MRIKNEIAILLLIPLIAFLIFWWQENYKKEKPKSFKEIKYVIEEKEGDKELIDEEKLEKALLNLKENITTSEIKEMILQIKGIKNCILSPDVENILTIKITPKTIFAKYKDMNTNENTYIDEDLELIETRKAPQKKNILIIKNTDLLKGSELNEYLRKISTLYNENDTIYMYEIKNNKIFSYDVLNKNNGEENIIEEDKKKENSTEQGEKEVK